MASGQAGASPYHAFVDPSPPINAGRVPHNAFKDNVYDPVVAGSIDGTDTDPHDRAVVRARKAIRAGVFRPEDDPKVQGDAYCTVFVARLNFATTEATLREAFERFGEVRRVRLVRCVGTGMSRGYGFVEFANETSFRRAFKEGHKMRIDGHAVLVEYERGRVMDSWVPRRLGGGIGGRKESGQLRFGGRDRPHKSPM